MCSIDKLQVPRSSLQEYMLEYMLILAHFYRLDSEANDTQLLLIFGVMFKAAVDPFSGHYFGLN